MSASREQVAAAILALNGPEVPFVWSPTPTGLTGFWNYADARWAGLFNAGSVDATYRIEVELHEDATYSLTDHTQQTTASARAGGLSFERSSFRGSVRKVSFNKSFAPVASDHGQVGNTYGWSFDSAIPKGALQEVLARHGWSERKRGFWARLTGG